MAQQITILDASRQVIGNAEAALCSSLEELTESFIIHLFEGGLESYREQFTYSGFWPIFAFNDIVLYPEHRRKGHGSRAINEIADHYQELGARLGLLKIGTQGDPFDAGVAWRTQMYASLGWVVLRHHSEEKATIPLMYLPMKRRVLTSKVPTRLIVVKEENHFNPIGINLPREE